MNKSRRVRASLDCNTNVIPDVLTRAQSMHDGMAADPVTYAAPNPGLPIFLGLITNLRTAQQAMPNRTRGSGGARDVQRDLLLTAMESERMYIQTLADATPLRAVPLIENAGLVVAGSPRHSKAVLTLSLGPQSGSIVCDANVSLLGAGTKHPNEVRFFNWEFTVDGGKSFVAAPPTPKGKTTLHGLTPLTTVGVRVNRNNAEGPGEWSQIVSILVQ